MLVLSTVRLCSLNLSLTPRLFSPTYCKLQRLYWPCRSRVSLLQVQLVRRLVMYGQVAQLTLEPNGLTAVTNYCNPYPCYFFFSSFFFLCVVRHFRPSLLNNLYCDILHPYNIVIPT